ncbi:hypothetical protein JZ751_013242, partial [Albula glossodonta]
MYRTKQKDSEDTIRKLEKKGEATLEFQWVLGIGVPSAGWEELKHQQNRGRVVVSCGSVGTCFTVTALMPPSAAQSLVRESQVVRESKDKQIVELKKMLDESADNVKNEWEKKLHTAVTEMEHEKLELQKKHTENIQELLDDTNQRLAKMESDYSAQMQGTEQVVKELEARVKQLSVEVENGNTLRQKVTQEKVELEIQIASISTELQESNRRTVTLMREKEELTAQHEKAMQKMQTKHEEDMSLLRQEQALSAAKASDVIVDLEQCVAQLRQQLQDSENKRQKQLRVRSLQIEVEKEKTDAKKRIAILDEAL